MRPEKLSREGTPANPRYYEGPVDVQGDVQQHYRFFAYETEEGFVAGAEATLTFTIDRPAKEVWPYYQDFNSWQPHHHYSAPMIDLYSRADRDLGTETFALGPKPDDLGPARYQVLKVIPERLIVFYQPIPKNGMDPHIPGRVSVSPGFMVFMLNEHGGKTIANIYMDHAFQTRGMTEAEALQFWRGENVVPEWVRKWRDDFIPTLKRLLYERAV